MIEAGDTLAGYRAERVLSSQTETGTVFRATRADDGAAVTLKAIAEHLGRDRRFRNRFFDEAELMSAVDHPAVAPVLEVGSGRDLLYVALGPVEAPSLLDVLREDELEAGRALRLLDGVAGGLDAAARVGLVHRDLRPGTIWVGRHDEAVLADFALGSAPASQREINTLEINARAEYISPEEVEGQATTARSNVYSLAAILVECLTGEPPFVEEGQVALLARHLYAPAPSVTKRRPELPGDLDAIVARALAKDPASRFPSCEALMAEVRRAFGEAGEDLSVGGFRGLGPAGGDEPGGTATLVGSSTATVLAPPRTRSGAAAPPPRRDTGARPRPTIARRGRRGAGVLAALLLLGAGGALAWALTAGRPEAPSATPAPAVRSAASAAVALSYPGNWKPADEAPEIPGLALTDPIALTGPDDDESGLVVGRAPDAGAYLLPAALRSRLAAPPTLDDTVRLGRLEAFRHRGLELEGYDPLLTLYSVPTSAGVVTAACFAPPDLADAFLPECERVASTLRLVGARALPVSPDAEYGEQVTAVVGRLNALRASRRGRFAGAQTPVGQADAAAGVANAYGAAAASLAASPPARRPERQANAAIVGALREAERAYVALARAARGNDRAGFNTARAAVRRAEGRVERSLQGLAAFGYAVR